MQPLAEPIVTGTRCQFIAVSRAYYPEWSTLKTMSVLPEAGPWTPFKVIWIEWVDGVAYGKGLGQVVKEIWGAQGTDFIDIYLG